MTATTQIIPALDLKDGEYVRLTQGRFDTTEVFGDDPLSLARAYVEAGATALHLVDLDAAQGQGKDNTATLAHIARALDVDIQVGGGLRTREALTRLFDAGVRRAVIGSLAITDPTTVETWLRDFGPDRIVLAFDVQSAAQPLVQINGWQEATRYTLNDALDRYRPVGLRHVLCTDISRDGMRAGPSIELYAKVLARYGDLSLQASGGVRHAGDVDALSQIQVPYVISGRALLEGTLQIEAQPA